MLSLTTINGRPLNQSHAAATSDVAAPEDAGVAPCEHEHGRRGLGDEAAVLADQQRAVPASVLATAASPPPDLAPLLALGLGKYSSNKENVSFQNLPSLKHGFGEV